jgi:nucleotide-binding universal stress UspA family protein
MVVIAVLDGNVPRIFVGVHGSVGSLHALRGAVTEARRTGGVLYSVIAWSAPGGDMLDRRIPDAHLRHAWRHAALRRLRAAWNDALGGVPDDLPVHLLTEQGRPGWVLTGLADTEDDLIVVGSGRRGLAHRSVARYCVAQSRCPVLVVPPPALARGLDHGVLPAAFRHRRALHDVLHHR